MSALVAVSATVGSANLLFTPSILNPSLAVAPVGMGAKASISPPSELAREAGEVFWDGFRLTLALRAPSIRWRPWARHRLERPPKDLPTASPPSRAARPRRTCGPNAPAN